MARELIAPPRDPQADPICLLTKEWADARQERPDRFLALTTSELITPDGVEYRLPGGDANWRRVESYIEEEGECCPFLGFEAHEAGSEIVLTIRWPQEVNR